MNVSKHAKERYAQRVMDRNNLWDINKYILDNSEIIEARIMKMIEYGEIIYSGRSISEYNKAITDVYMCDNWVIIVDPSKNNVVTLYEINLGLDKDFNDAYVEKLKEKIKLAKSNFAEKIQKIEDSKSQYSDLIKENQSLINEYRRLANELDEQNEAYKSIIDSLKTDKDIAENEVRNIVGVLVGRKVY